MLPQIFSSLSRSLPDPAAPIPSQDLWSSSRCHVVPLPQTSASSIQPKRLTFRGLCLLFLNHLFPPLQPHRPSSTVRPCLCSDRHPVPLLLKLLCFLVIRLLPSLYRWQCPLPYLLLSRLGASRRFLQEGTNRSSGSLLMMIRSFPQQPKHNRTPCSRPVPLCPRLKLSQPALCLTPSLSGYPLTSQTEL